MDWNIFIQTICFYPFQLVLFLFGGVFVRVHEYLHKKRLEKIIGDQCIDKEDLLKYDDLLNLSATRLALMIRNREISSEKIVLTYIRRIIVVNPLINAMCNERFLDALNEAKRVDRRLEAGEEVPEEQAFLGVPITIKESFAVEGMSNVSGMVHRAEDYARVESDAVAVQRLKKAGFIVIGVTNTSELCLWWESYNKIYGRTNNPYDLSRIVGGSTGGEAALIAAAGSVVGLGSDIGGSIRMPAFFNGIFGHKSSGGLIPSTGMFPAPKSVQVDSYCTAGPLSRYSEDLQPLLQILANKSIRAIGSIDLTKIKVISINDNGGSICVTSLHPELRSIQQRVFSFFQQCFGTDHVQQVDPCPELSYAHYIWMSYVSEDRNLFEQYLGGVSFPNILYHLFHSFSGQSDHTFPIILNWFSASMVAPKSRMKPHYDRLKSFFDQLLDDDTVIIYPSHPAPARRHYYPHLVPFDFIYTAVLNILEFPVTQCPLGLNSEGLPLGIQIVAKKGNDHLTIALASMLEREFGGWQPPQFKM